MELSSMCIGLLLLCATVPSTAAVGLGSRQLLQSTASSCAAGYSSSCQKGLLNACQVLGANCQSNGFNLLGEQCCCCPPAGGSGSGTPATPTTPKSPPPTPMSPSPPPPVPVITIPPKSPPPPVPVVSIPPLSPPPPTGSPPPPTPVESPPPPTPVERPPPPTPVESPPPPAPVESPPPPTPVESPPPPTPVESPPPPTPVESPPPPTPVESPPPPTPVESPPPPTPVESPPPPSPPPPATVPNPVTVRAYRDCPGGGLNVLATLTLSQCECVQSDVTDDGNGVSGIDYTQEFPAYSVITYYGSNCEDGTDDAGQPYTLPAPQFVQPSCLVGPDPGYQAYALFDPNTGGSRATNNAVRSYKYNPNGIC